MLKFLKKAFWVPYEDSTTYPTVEKAHQAIAEYCDENGHTYVFSRAAPHNGARRFGERFGHKRKYGKCGNTGCISHFSYCTLGAKDPPKPAVPIVRCCPSADEVIIDGVEHEIYRGLEPGSRGNYGIKCSEK